MSRVSQEKSLQKCISEYCQSNQEQYVRSVNQDFDRIVVRGFVGILFVIGALLVDVACYLNMEQTWLLFAHVPSCLFLLSAWLIFPLLPVNKRPAILWFDITLLIMLVEIYFIIGAYWKYSPQTLAEMSTLGIDLFVFLCLSTHPNRWYRLLRDTFFIAGNFAVIVVHNPTFLQNSSESIDFLRFGAIYGMSGIAIATVINFFARFRFYFDFVNRASKLHAYQQMGKLLYQHQIAEIDAGRPLEATMPVGTGKAAVICFDVQNSAALGHDRCHEFFESVNKKSYELMIGHYQEDTRVSDAFLIKEMGDGFLCSVGFPFPALGAVQEQAVLLADQFIQLFKSESAHFFPDQTVLCAVGIAFGDVTGRFPMIGVRSYDLFGDAIVKATRYESMRKILIPEFAVAPGHIIILQAGVYEALPEQLQKQFQRIELRGIRVRDDAAATHLYCRVDRPRSMLQAIA